MTPPSHDHPTASPTDADLIADAREHARILRRAAVAKANGETDA